jgi:heat shock 70kDa protein 1/2/6/8
MTKDNHFLGEYKLEGILPAPRGVPKIEVIFDINVDGILEVSIAYKDTGKTYMFTITNENDRLSKESIDRMVNEAEEFKGEDEVSQKNI